MNTEQSERRFWGGEWVTQDSVCSSTDRRPCGACYECWWWEHHAREYVPPPDYPNSPKPWEPAYQDGRRRYSG